MMLVDVGAAGKTGKEIEALLDQANITVNKNTIPFETRSPFVTSGIRVGTPGRYHPRHEGRRYACDRQVYLPHRI